MYDSTNPAAIPANAAMVAGYVDGAYAWSAADWARFPGAVKVRIAVFSTTNDGHVGDCEPGCMSVAGAVGWVQTRRRSGVDPTVYCNTSTWPSVVAAFRAAGVAEPHYWVAQYDGSPVIPAGAVAKQYADPPNGSGGNFDKSVVADYWPGVDSTASVNPLEVLLTTPTPADGEALIWAVYTLINNLDTIPHGPNAGQPNKLAAALVALQANVDGMVAAADQHEGALRTDVDAKLDAIQTAVAKPPTVALSASDLTALEQAVTAAVAAGAATPAQIAQATVTLFAAKLGAA